MTIDLHPNLRGVSPHGVNSTNSWGMRGSEPPKEWEKSLTFMAVGGSTTQCHYLDDHKTWTYILEQKLKQKYKEVWIGNAGMDGRTTRSHLLFMKEVMPKIPKPDFILFFFGINDLTLNIVKDYQKNGSPFDNIINYKILSASRLGQLLYTWLLVLTKQAVIVGRSGHGNFVPHPIIQEENVSENLTSMLPFLPEYRQNIVDLIRLSREMNIKPIFITKPMLFSDTAYWKKIEGSFYWIQKTKVTLSAATYWRLMDIYNQTMLQVCKEEGVTCFDIASIIPHEETYFYDSVHFTEAGARLVGETISRLFLKMESGKLPH